MLLGDYFGLIREPVCICCYYPSLLIPDIHVCYKGGRFEKKMKQTLQQIEMYCQQKKMGKKESTPTFSACFLTPDG